MLAADAFAQGFELRGDELDDPDTDVEALARELGESTNFVGVDVLESPEAGQGMIVKTGVTYRQAVDPTGEALAAFGGVQLPLPVVLRPDGTVESLTNRALRDAAELKQLIEAAA